MSDIKCPAVSPAARVRATALLAQVGVCRGLQGCLAALFASVLALALAVPSAYAEPTSSTHSEASGLGGESNVPVTDYLARVASYESALERQEVNARNIANIEIEIDEAEVQLEKSQAHLGQASVEMYKNGIQPGELLETVLAAPSLSESVVLYDDYTRLQAHRRQQCEEARAECELLKASLSDLEAQRDSLAAEVAANRKALADAKNALRKAAHLDGEKYHQTQRNGVNCGATAFIVGVNILLGENRFTDNAEVWESDAFAKDSTVNLVEKGTAWLKDNKLDDLIGFQYVQGDIHKADQLRALLEKGGVVVISSGSGSQWQRVDAADAQKGLYPGGHFICFYGYREGIFYANDSAVSAKRGAGCPYTEKQMQQWLDGRAYHAACVLTKKAE